MNSNTSLPDVGRFYSAIARPYDLFASSPLFAHLRSDAVSGLDLTPESRVLEIGCGTGGNIPFLASHLGQEATYYGLDASRGMLRRAASRNPRFEASFLQADATDPPVSGKFDGILVTFVNGVLPDPPKAVTTWTSLLRPGGRLVLLDAAGRPDTSTPLDWGFAAFVTFAAPPGTRNRYDRSPDEVLVDRVEAAHDALAAEARLIDSRTHWLGFVRIGVATVD